MYTRINPIVFLIFLSLSLWGSVVIVVKSMVGLWSLANIFDPSTNIHYLAFFVFCFGLSVAIARLPLVNTLLQKGTLKHFLIGFVPSYIFSIFLLSILFRFLFSYVNPELHPGDVNESAGWVAILLSLPYSATLAVLYSGWNKQ